MRIKQRTDEFVLCISPGLGGRWDLAEKGFERLIASFEEKEDAYAYALDLTRHQQDATVLVEEGDEFFVLPKHARTRNDVGHGRRAA